MGKGRSFEVAAGSAGSGLDQFDVAFFTASCDTPETNQKYAAALKLDYPILSDPAKDAAKAYGVVHEGLPSFLSSAVHYSGPRTLEPRGVIAVSVTLLQGLYLKDPEFYAPLRALTPAASLGGSILIYDLREPRP